MKLVKGKIYKVINNVKMGDLLENKRYVFVGETSNHMITDRIRENLINRTYHFFDIEKKSFCEWIVEGDEEHQGLTLPIYLSETKEGWVRPDAGEVIALKPEDFDITRGKDLLREYLAYFKSIVEGKEDVENIFVWMEQYAFLLSSVMNGKEKLEFRMYPFKSLCYWLDYFSIPYEINYKYYWLDKTMNAW